MIIAVTSLLGESADRAAAAGVARTIGTIAAMMTSLHGAYDLAALAEPASATSGDISPVDPRGFATFALTGLATIVIAALARGDSRFPNWLSTVGVLLGAALVATWLGRLTVVDPTTPWLRISTAVAALLSPVVQVGFAAVFQGAGRRLSVRPLAA